MKVIHFPAEMKAWARDQTVAGKSIGLVPTMGSFHQGHLSLMRLAAGRTDTVVVSLYVNPGQFGPGEDFTDYPRDFARDCQLAAAEKVDVIFAPTDQDMYPRGFQTSVSVKQLSEKLCGASRPGHFDGVATVVTKLFHLCGADCAVFGEKDFQQLAVIRRLVADLDLDVAVIGHPIVREADGLAMSSRNSYLDDRERRTALCLYESLLMARDEAAAGLLDTDRLGRRIEDHILSYPGTEIDYVAFVDPLTLEPVDNIDSGTLLALAVKINGRVRLIDNCLVLT